MSGENKRVDATAGAVAVSKAGSAPLCGCRPGEACSECYEGPLRVPKATRERVIFHKPGCRAFVDGECDQGCPVQEIADRPTRDDAVLTTATSPKSPPSSDVAHSDAGGGV